MPRRRLLAASCTALAVAALAPAAAASGTTGPAVAPVVRSDAVRTVFLPTGDAVRVGAVDGRTSVDVVAAQPDGVTGSFLRTTMQGHQYVLPAEVRPLLGTVLDPSLFDVTALAATSDAAGIPVRLSLQPGARPAVPGLTIDSRNGTSATGHLSAGGAAAFRAALVRAWRSAIRPGASAPTSLFGGVTRLAGARASAPVQPSFPQLTLTIKVLDDQGQPASGAFIGILNTDDGRRYNNFAVAENGIAKVSVPTGHYSAITDIGTFTDDSFADLIVPVADFTVSESEHVVTIDARTATVDPSVSVPRPARTTLQSAEFDRLSRRIGSLGFSYLFGGRDTYRVAPSGPPQVGSLYWLTGYSMHSTGGSDHYTYDLSFLDTNTIPASQDRVVQSYQVAKIAARYYADTPSSRYGSAFGRSALYPFQFFVFGELDPLATPTARTEYVVGDPSARWSDTLITNATRRNPFGDFVSDGLRIYPAGSSQRADWLRGPLAPAPVEQAPGDSFYFCPACRTDNRLSVILAPVADTRPGHSGSVSDPANGSATAFSLSRDGTVLASGHDLIGARVKVPSDDAEYQLHLYVDRSASGTRTSTATTTDLTFHSSATSGVDAPPSWFCGIGDATTCTVVPILRATVPLPTDLSDQLPVGRSSFVLTVAPYEGAGSATITSARVSIRVGQGSFEPAQVSRIANGRYQVTLDNPDSAAGQPVDLRVAASDDQGDSIVQTTQAAYLVAAAAAGR